MYVLCCVYVCIVEYICMYCVMYEWRRCEVQPIYACVVECMWMYCGVYGCIVVYMYVLCIWMYCSIYVCVVYVDVL